MPKLAANLTMLFTEYPFADRFERAAANGFAAGALLVMLVDSMIPEATSKSGRVAGLATTLGFALAAGLSTASA